MPAHETGGSVGDVFAMVLAMVLAMHGHGQPFCGQAVCLA
jgi:hypothetical protein